jgi:uncharacterized delta-60 repeat protein
MILEPNGNVLLGGDSNYRDALAMFKSNGALDPAFGVHGLLTNETFGHGSTVMARTADGGFLMAGGSWNAPNPKTYFHARLYDNAGHNRGDIVVDMGDYAYVNGAAVQPDGKILLVGRSQVGMDSDFGVVRCHPDGSLDAGFGNGGKVRTDSGKTGDIAYAVAVQPDGKILVAGSFGSGAENSKFALVRYTANGALDPTFHSNGVVTSFGPGCDAFAIALQNDGKIVLAGWDNLRMALLRYELDGRLDTSFGEAGTGLALAQVGNWDAWTGVKIQPDGKVVVGGQSASDGRAVVARYGSNGILDTNFGQRGLSLVRLGNKLSEVSEIAVQPDGRILIAGSAWRTTTSNSDLALARLENDGAELPVISCVQSSKLKCGELAELIAIVTNASGLPLTVTWSVNEQAVQTNSIPGGNPDNATAISYSGMLPIGTNVVSVSATDIYSQTATCRTLIEVVDSIPPWILSAQANPAVLWPPNRRMVPIALRVAAEDVCSATGWRITGVQSSDPPGHGGGQGQPDWMVTGEQSLLLRAERSSPARPRVYAIGVQAYDTSGNVSTPFIVKVTVSIRAPDEGPIKRQGYATGLHAEHEW